MRLREKWRSWRLRRRTKRGKQPWGRQSEVQPAGLGRIGGTFKGHAKIEAKVIRRDEFGNVLRIENLGVVAEGDV